MISAHSSVCVAMTSTSCGGLNSSRRHASVAGDAARCLPGGSAFKKIPPSPPTAIPMPPFSTARLTLRKNPQHRRDKRAIAEGLRLRRLRRKVIAQDLPFGVGESRQGGLERHRACCLPSSQAGLHLTGASRHSRQLRLSQPRQAASAYGGVTEALPMAGMGPTREPLAHRFPVVAGNLRPPRVVVLPSSCEGGDSHARPSPASANEPFDDWSELIRVIHVDTFR